MKVSLEQDRRLLLEEDNGVTDIGFPIQNILHEMRIPGLNITYDLSKHPIWVELNDGKRRFRCEEVVYKEGFSGTGRGFRWSELVSALQQEDSEVKTVYTVPLHVGQNIEVPKGSKVTYY